MKVSQKITDAVIANVPAEVKRVVDTEIRGFYLDVGAQKTDGSRRMSYYLYYRIGGRHGTERRYKIGEAAVMTAGQARAEAKKLKSRVNLNEDVFLTRKNEQRRAEHEEDTGPDINLLADEFMRIYVANQRKRPEEVERMLNADIRPTLGQLKLGKLKARDIITLCLDPIVARGSNVQANKTLSLLKQMLGFGIGRGLIDSNVLAHVQRQNIGGNEIPRDRVLSHDEIEKVFKKLPQLKIHHQIITVLKLIVLTGCRSNEICEARWSEIDFRQNMWVIPKERVKATLSRAKVHKVPLTPVVISILAELKAAYGYLNSPYILPSLKPASCLPGQKALDKRSVARAIKRNLSKLGVEPFVPHDLRATFATRLGDDGLDVDPFIVEKLLNHSLGGVAGKYNRNEYLEKRSSALNRWHESISPSLGKVANDEIADLGPRLVKTR
jgi:integrase